MLRLQNNWDVHISLMAEAQRQDEQVGVLASKPDTESKNQAAIWHYI